MAQSMQQMPASSASMISPQHMGAQSSPPGAFNRGGIQPTPSSLGTCGGGLPPASYPGGAYGGGAPQSYGGPLTQNAPLGSAPNVGGMSMAPMQSMQNQGPGISRPMDTYGGGMQQAPLGSVPMAGMPPMQSAGGPPLPPPAGAPPGMMSQMGGGQMSQMGGQPSQNVGQFMPNVARPQVVAPANPPVMANNIQYGPSYKMQYQRRSTSDKNAVKYTGFLPLEGVYEEDTCRIG